MKITILNFVEGARNADGLVVIIDVFRAFSLECYLFDKGCKQIFLVGEAEDAFNLLTKFPDAVLIGERKERKIEGFHFGNSPSEILPFEFKGKTIIHTTTAGTQGIINAINADQIITGSFVNAGAIIRYIQKIRPAKVSLVCMGYRALEKTEEDTLCAEYIYNGLKGLETDFSAIKRKIKGSSGKRFFDPEKAEFCPPQDFNLCLDLNRFNFIIKAEHEIDKYWVNKKIEILN